MRNLIKASLILATGLTFSAAANAQVQQPQHSPTQATTVQQKKDSLEVKAVEAKRHAALENPNATRPSTPQAPSNNRNAEADGQHKKADTPNTPANPNEKQEDGTTNNL